MLDENDRHLLFFLKIVKLLYQFNRKEIKSLVKSKVL